MTDHESIRLDFALDIDFSGVLTNPILDIAARVWEADRYEAFQICYRSMRRVDDLVDDLKTKLGAVPEMMARKAESEITGWLDRVRTGRAEDEYGRRFISTLERFTIPLWPWERLGKAMVYDLRHRGFASFRTFLRYSEGAAISPAAVFMHLCGVTKTPEGYRAPDYDIRKSARSLAIFSYLTHIMRDFEKDQKAGLNYFADTVLADVGLTADEVRRMAQSGQIDDRMRQVMKVYQALAARYQQMARSVVDETLPFLDQRYQLSLELIYSLYSQIFSRVDPDTGGFTGKELNPTPEEVDRRVKETIKNFRPVTRMSSTVRQIIS
jgi:phytoene/squalene synthetase